MLCELSSQDNFPSLAAEMFSNVIVSTMSAALTVFRLDPASISFYETEKVATILANAYTHQPRLSASFWSNEQQMISLPIHQFLDGLASLFPAVSHPFLKLLAALAGDNSAANTYLAHVPYLCCLHTVPNTSFEIWEVILIRNYPALLCFFVCLLPCLMIFLLFQDENGVHAITEAPLSLPGSHVLTMPKVYAVL